MGQEMSESKVDKLVFYLMTVFLGIIILGGSAWATSINSKVERIGKLETNIQYMQSDIAEIKNLISGYIKRN